MRACSVAEPPDPARPSDELWSTINSPQPSDVEGLSCTHLDTWQLEGDAFINGFTERALDEALGWEGSWGPFRPRKAEATTQLVVQRTVTRLGDWAYPSCPAPKAPAPSAPKMLML